jgi:hypothetical protein
LFDLGRIGVWSNGVSIFNSELSDSYKDQGYWTKNVYTTEDGELDKWYVYNEILFKNKKKLILT